MVVRRVTIGVKIFAIAAGLLILMDGVAFLTLNLAHEVGEQLDRVIDNYIPAYDSLSNANVGRVEQGRYLRRLVIAQLLSPSDGKSIQSLKRIYTEKGQLTDVGLAMVRKEISARLADPGRFSDVAALARLDTRIEQIAEERQRYEKQVVRALTALERKDQVTFRREMDTVDTFGDELIASIDSARHDMLGLAQAAAEATRVRQAQVIRLSFMIMAVAGALGLTAAGLISFTIVRPVRRLLAGTQAVKDGQLDHLVPVTSGDEIGDLTNAFNEMVCELRTKERIRETSGKYIDPRIVEGLIDRPALTGAAGDRRVMTIFFCDMKSFTSISEGLTPTGLVNLFNHYLTTMSAPIRQHRGVIDKYVGDAIMAFWGPPFNTAVEQAGLACSAALDQLANLQPFREKLPELMGIRRGIPEINMRIGIATGEVVVGNIGSDVMKSFTAMGDTVNFASRLEGVSKIYGTHLLVDETTAKLAGDTIETREIDSIVVAGKTEAHRIFEVLGRKGEIHATRDALRTHFADGLAAYRAQDWALASSEFKACLAVVPDDGPATVFLGRIAHLSEHPPGPDWNGVWTLSEK